MSGKLPVGSKDIHRVESKITSALQARMERAGDAAKDRIKGLHAFLEEVEGRDSLSKSKDSLFSKESTFREPIKYLSIEKEQEYLGSLAQAKASISSLQIELQSSRQDCDALRRALEEERHTCRTKEIELIAKLNQKEEEFSNEIQGSFSRQHEVISKLISDKQSLSDQVASLVSQLRLSDQKTSKLVSDMKEKFKSEIKEAHQVWLTGEKEKREKWKQQKEKEIKEVTIKGLEPEVERMLSKHREERGRFESDAAEQVRKEKLRLEAEYQTRLDEFKKKVLLENETLLRREKEFIQQHFEGLTKDTSNLAQRHLEEAEVRLKREIEEEREKRKHEADYWQGRLQAIQREHLESTVRIKEEFEAERRDWRKRVEDERHRVKGALSDEEKTIRKKVEEELERSFTLKTEQIRLEILKERDNQIQIIVDRLLKEKADEIEQAIKAEREKLKQKKTQADSALDDLKTELILYKERLSENKAAYSRLSDENDARQRSVENLIKENEDQRQQIVRLKTRVKGLEEELESGRISIRAMEKSFADQLDLEKRKALESRQEYHDVIIRHKEEKEIMARELEERQVVELESLESRVKGVLDRKDREISDLKLELDEKTTVCLKYEQLLDRQRRDLLGGFG